MSITINKLYFYYFLLMLFVLQLMEHIFPGTYKIKLLFPFISLVSFIFFILYNNIKINLYKKNLLFLLLFFMSAYISSLLSTNTLEGFFRIGTYLFPLILGFIISKYKTLEFMDAFYRALLIFNFIIFILSIFQNNFDNQFRFGGILNMATVIVMHLYTLAIILIIRYFYDKKRWYLPVIILIYVLIFLTQSRTGMFISLFIPLLLFLYLKKFRLLLLFSLLFGIIIIIYFDEIQEAILLLARIKEVTETSPREHWIEQAYHAIRQSPFFGIGMGNIPSWHESISNPDTSGVLFPSSIERVANQVGYHLLLAENGIVGFSLFIIWIIYTLKTGFKKLYFFKNKNRESYIQILTLYTLFIAYSINISTESFIGTAFDVFTISLFVISGILTNIKEPL